MDLASDLLAPADPSRRRHPKATQTSSDKAFQGGVAVAASITLLIIGLIAFFLFWRAYDALSSAGLSFFTTSQWFPETGHFGVVAVILGTVLIAAVALISSVPIAIGCSLYISEYAPRSLRKLMISLIDLMAAVPSIVYGLWGLGFLQPAIIPTSRWISDHFSFIPFLRVDQANYASSTFIAGMVVGIMVIPIASSVMREVFSQAPPSEREGAYALGSTRWGMVRSVVLPFGRAGMVGGIMLGLGRALGETIAVVLIISIIFDPAVLVRVLEGNGASISALIALRYSEASEFGLSALMAAGLVLFLITLLVNTLAAMIVRRSRSGVGTEI